MQDTEKQLGSVTVYCEIFGNQQSIPYIFVTVTGNIQYLLTI